MDESAQHLFMSPEVEEEVKRELILLINKFSIPGVLGEESLEFLIDLANQLGQSIGKSAYMSSEIRE